MLPRNQPDSQDLTPRSPASQPDACERTANSSTGKDSLSFRTADSPASASDFSHPYEAFGDQMATRLLSAEAMVTQRLSATVNLLADLAARVATLESPSTTAPRPTPPAEQAPTERTPSQPADHLSGTGRMSLRPPTYDGTTSWAAFRIQFESVASFNCWTSEEKLLVLVAQLRSTAAELLNCLPRVGRSTYNDLVCALEARFGDAPFRSVYIAQLRTLRQGQATLRDLADTVEPLSRKSSLDVLNTFVCLGRPANLRAALALALEAQVVEPPVPASRGLSAPIQQCSSCYNSAFTDSTGGKLVSTIAAGST
ncbi:hypothetical protein HPB52_000021 [Rhipicephalus sanguineus]|uniref:Uncharacterized protein n=1 Tax=Rhipicephalus sanguineus TaxID=34632 RepID=A0A9D4T839_RHISA|nr:hypothetical protein HPB52_000021 [Rhipicephalus sanguineus]